MNKLTKDINNIINNYLMFQINIYLKYFLNLKQSFIIVLKMVLHYWIY